MTETKQGEPCSAVTCPACGHTLGTCTPSELQVGSVRIRGNVRLECARCGKQRTWYPAPPPAPNPA